MPNARLVYVDSFAAPPLAGNPAAVLLLDQEPNDGLGARIGAELDQPATAVLWPAGAAARTWSGPLVPTGADLGNADLGN
jgi:predicted PhzF superfamily epimerase YddE/YHI9